MSDLIDKMIGQYQIVEEIGAGGMATVYKAHQSSINRYVAIKVLPTQFARDPNFVKRFHQEARAIAALEHVHILPLHDFGTINGYTYMVMRYITGGTLADLMGKSIPYERIVQLISDIANALDYAHRQGVIHRDIKPSNILIDKHGEALLTDFGIAKRVAGPDATKITGTGLVLGTPEYVAPEQAEGETIDGRSDIYSLGVVLYELLTGRPPYKAKTPLAVVMMHVKGTPPPLPRAIKPDIPEPLERVTLKAMARNPEDRFQTASEMANALKEALKEIELTKATLSTAPSPAQTAEMGTVGQTPAAAQPSEAATSKRRFGLVALTLLLLILGGVAFVVLGGGTLGETSPEQAAALAEEQLTSTPTETAVPTPTTAPTDTPTTAATTPMEETAVAEATSRPTPEPTATPTAELEAPVASGIPEASLVGTIAYPVFNGTDYDLYLGQADGSDTRFFRAQASQPAFSPDGARIAFHSWRTERRGLVTMDIGAAGGILITNFREDHLPTWSPDGKEIFLLSRRSGERKSQLIRVSGTEQIGEVSVIGEGEYPSVGPTGQLAFKGWGNTGTGLRLATLTLDNIQPLTDLAEDTAPAISPDGQKIAFMSNRDGNWEIYVVNADGSGRQRVTDDPANDGLPAWSPDGRVLAFISNRGGAWAVWAATPNGSDQRQLFAMEGSPDGFVGTDINSSRGWTEERISWTR